MTFDEFKEYTKAALELAGDTTPDMRAHIVITAMNQAHVQMPSDLKRMEEAMQARPGDLAILGGSASQQVGRNQRGPLPTRIG